MHSLFSHYFRNMNIFRKLFKDWFRRLDYEVTVFIEFIFIGILFLSFKNFFFIFEYIKCQSLFLFQDLIFQKFMASCWVQEVNDLRLFIIEMSSIVIVIPYWSLWWYHLAYIDCCWFSKIFKELSQYL